MIVMEYLDWPPIHSLDHDRIPVELKITAVQSVKNALNVLKYKNMVHGDLRMNNILLVNNGTVKIIDFEFSGCTAGPTPARYPPFLNKSGEIEWAPGVRCDGPLAVEHDLFFLYEALSGSGASITSSGLRNNPNCPFMNWDDYDMVQFNCPECNLIRVIL
jgi:serine/threonine protein kinase